MANSYFLGGLEGHLGLAVEDLGDDVFTPPPPREHGTKIIIWVRVHGRFEGRVGIRVRGHKGTLVILGYGTHGQ